MAGDFEGKTVIITGASAGVGASVARAFAKEKAKLVLLARGQEALEKIVNELSLETEVLGITLDVVDTKACIEMLAKAEAHFGAVHILINNAGCHHRGPVEDNEADKLAFMVDVNLRAPIELSRLVLPYIRRAGSGAIVNVGSLAGRTPMQGSATYAATKAGLRAFTHSLADELRGSGIFVGVVSPGPIDTGFIMSEIDDVEDIVFSQPMSSSEQVADAVMSIARGEEVEIALPAISGLLTTVSYLLPPLRRALRPVLYKKGRKEKEKYRQRGLR